MDGEKYTFINQFYLKEQWKNKKGTFKKVADDAMIVVYKKGDKQIIRIIENPDFSFYIAKQNVDVPKYIDFISRDSVDLVTIKYHDLEKILADYCGRTEEYNYIKSAGKYASYEEKMETRKRFIKSLHMNPRIFGSDRNIEEWYKQQFVKQHGVHIGGYKLMFFDIETDTFSDPSVAKSPINVMSFYFQPSNTMYTLIRDDEKTYPTIAQFKNDLASGAFLARLKADPDMNGQTEGEGKATFTNKDTTYIFEFFDNDFEIIKRRYKIIHELKPDFCYAWNFSFDEMTCINRAKNYIERHPEEGRLEDLLCHPDVPPKFRFWNFREDKNPRHEYYDKWHILSIPGYTQYICAMSTFANIRKGRGSFSSYSLNDICMTILKKGKLDYSNIAIDPIELPKVDFATHVHYNIKDTWMMACLEAKTRDINALMYLAELSSLSNVCKKTSIVTNRMIQFYENNGLVMANNKNALIQNPETGYEGAIVASPHLNEALMTPLFPYPSKMIRPFISDADLASLYPSIVILFNTYKTGLEFQIDKIGQVSQVRDNISAISIPECFDNLLTGDIMSWTHDYLQMPSIGNMVVELDKELKRLGGAE